MFIGFMNAAFAFLAVFFFTVFAIKSPLRTLEASVDSVARVPRALQSENADGKTDRVRLPAPAWRQGTRMAVLADDAAVARDPRPHRPGVRRPRGAAPPVGSVLVSSIWLC